MPIDDNCSSEDTETFRLTPDPAAARHVMVFDLIKSGDKHGDSLVYTTILD
jgi:hypothetical protein